MKKIRILAIIFSLHFLTPSVSAIGAVASIKMLVGDVKVQRSQRLIPALKGLVLNDEDVVITGQHAKVVFIFRDGSEIRLFQNSRFIIEKSEEIESSRKGLLGKLRLFSNRLKLDVGAFWGKFVKDRQQTKIVTPTATIGIKGTVVSVAQKAGKLGVSLSVGSVQIENEDEQIMLQSGKMVEGITKRGSFKEKVKTIPYRVDIEPDNKKFSIPAEGNEEKIFFTLQLVDVKSKKNIQQRGVLFISVSVDKIIFPAAVYLNKRGYARLSATVKPFQKVDYGNGQVDVYAVIEGEGLMNIGAGHTILNYDIPEEIQRTIRIDASTGEIQ